MVEIGEVYKEKSSGPIGLSLGGRLPNMGWEETSETRCAQTESYQSDRTVLVLVLVLVVVGRRVQHELRVPHSSNLFLNVLTVSAWTTFSDNLFQ